MYIIDIVNEEEEERQESEEEQNTTENSKNCKETVLIVEDNTDIQQYLNNELGKFFHILKAGNGKKLWLLSKNRK